MSSGTALKKLFSLTEPFGSAFTRGAVVGDADDERVVELAGLLEVVDQAPDLVIGVGAVARVDLGHARKEPLLVSGERVPGAHQVAGREGLAVNALAVGQGVDRREVGRLRDDPHLLLLGEDGLADLLVAHVELALVLVGPLLRRLVRCVTAARAVVHEEGPLGRHLLGVGDHRDGPVGEVRRRGGSPPCRPSTPRRLAGSDGWSTNCWSCTRSGYHWLVSPPR